VGTETVVFERGGRELLEWRKRKEGRVKGSSERQRGIVTVEKTRNSGGKCKGRGKKSGHRIGNLHRGGK